MIKKLSLLLLFCWHIGILTAQITAPNFSHPHGIYEDSFSLKISCTDSLSTIYYTTNGVAPSASNGKIYTTPLQITHTTVLRAVSVSPNGMSSEVTTATYIFLDDVLKQNNTPEGYPSEWGKYATRSGKAIADYEMDPEMTADEELCRLIKEGFRSLPIASIVTDPSHLFNKEENDSTGGIYIYTGAPSGSGKPGRGWERPTSFEYFDAQGKHDLQVNCGIKIHGGHSRLPEKSPKHSFRLTFKDKYGPSKLRYPLFGEDEAQTFNAIVLRTAFCNAWHHQESSQRKIAVYSRDMWAKHTQKAMGHLTTNGTYAHLFINGLYWGLYNPTERIDDDFCDLHLKGDKEDFDVIKVEEYGVSHVVMADAGTLDKWNELFRLAENANDMTTYLRLLGQDNEGIRNTDIEPLLDADNFIDYMLINYYGGNTDWDSHNWLAVRNRVAADNGFHFICWDSEHILKSIDEDVMNKNTKLSPTYLFNKLIENPVFRHRFMDRVQKHCFDNGVLTPVHCAQRWLALDAVIDTALYCEQARWGDYRRDVHPYTSKGSLYTVDTHYKAQREFLLEEYFPKRTDKFLTQLRKKGWFPEIDAPAFYYKGVPTLSIDTIDAEEGLTLKGDGNIFYTLDGEDPVSWIHHTDGAATESAIIHDGEKILSDKDFTLKAITFKDNQWSAIREQRFIVRTQESQAISYSSLPNLKAYITQETDQPQLIFILPTDASVSVSIYNLQGIELCKLQHTCLTTSGKHHMALPVQQLPTGLYLCILTVDGVRHTSKFGIP